MILLKKKTQLEANSISSPHMPVAKFLSIHCCQQTEVEIIMKAVIQKGSLTCLYSVTVLLSKMLPPAFNILMDRIAKFSQCHQELGVYKIKTEVNSEG